MSRGHGRLQRVLLAELQHAAQLYAADPSRRECSTWTLAVMAFDVPEVDGYWSVTEAQLVSTRRALRKLQREGLVGAMGRRYGDAFERWATTEVAAAYRQRVRDVFGLGDKHA